MIPFANSIRVTGTPELRASVESKPMPVVGTVDITTNQFILLSDPVPSIDFILSYDQSTPQYVPVLDILYERRLNHASPAMQSVDSNQTPFYFVVHNELFTQL